MLLTEKLKKSETRLRNAQKVAHVGNWEIDLATNMIWGSEEAIRIYGLDPEVPEYPLNRVQEMVLPEFRPMMDQALKSLINGDHEYNVEFQLKRESDNNIRYIHSIAELIRNQDGKPVMIAGTIQDITDRKRYEIELSNKNADLEKLNKIMINRELRMVELKEKIKELEAKLNHV
jgi:PAS domain S-box-containing protein